MGGQRDDITNIVRFLQDENQRLKQEGQDLQEENAYLRECLRSIRGIQRALSSVEVSGQLKPLLDTIIYEALRMVDAADGSLSLVDEETQEVMFVVVRGTLHDQLEGFRVSMNDGLVGWVIAHQEPAIANDISHDARFSPTIDLRFGFQTQALICVPLISRKKVLGAVEVVNKFSGHPFDERDLDMLSVLALIAAAAIDLAGFQCSEAENPDA
jgi:GAF domain-containing protein